MSYLKDNLFWAKFSLLFSLTKVRCFMNGNGWHFCVHLHLPSWHQRIFLSFLLWCLLCHQCKIIPVKSVINHFFPKKSYYGKWFSLAHGQTSVCCHQVLWCLSEIWLASNMTGSLMRSTVHWTSVIIASCLIKINERVQSTSEHFICDCQLINYFPYSLFALQRCKLNADLQINIRSC